MTDDDLEFDTVSSGSWIKGADLIDKWVFFRVLSTEDREGTFGDETVAEVDFADLTAASPELEYGLRNSDKHIAGKLVGRKLVVGRVAQAEPKQKGWKGAIYLEQPPGEELTAMQAKAKALLAQEKAAKAKPAPAKPKPTGKTRPSTKSVEDAMVEELLGDL